MYRFKSTPIQNSAWIIDMRSSDLLMLYNFGHCCDIVVIYIYMMDLFLIIIYMPIDISGSLPFSLISPSLVYWWFPLEVEMFPTLKRLKGRGKALRLRWLIYIYDMIQKLWIWNLLISWNIHMLNSNSINLWCVLC